MWVRLDDIGIYKKGPFGSSLTKGIFVDKGLNSIKVYEQKNAIYKNQTLGTYYITKEYFEQKMKGFEVFPGDIIVSCAGTIGETFVMPENMEKGIINQALMKIRLSAFVFVPYFLLFFECIIKKAFCIRHPLLQTVTYTTMKLFCFNYCYWEIWFIEQ